MEARIAVLARWAAGQSPGPYKVQLNPTDQCNLACGFCWSRDSSRLDYRFNLSRRKYLEIIQEAAGLGVQEIEITGGGEPLMRHDDTLAMMEAVSSTPMRGLLFTNGTLFEADDFAKITDMGWQEILVSLDSHLSPVHDRLRGVEGSHARTVEAIETFCAKRRSMGTACPELNLHFVVCSANFREIPEMVSFAAGLGCDNIFFQPMLPVVPESADLVLGSSHHNELKSSAARGAELAAELGIGNNLHYLLEKNRGEEETGQERSSALPPCFEPWLTLVIRPNGRSGPCCSFEYDGDDIHHKGIAEVWHGPYFRRFRERLNRGELLEHCESCYPGRASENLLLVRQALQAGIDPGGLCADFHARDH